MTDHRVNAIKLVSTFHIKTWITREFIWPGALSTKYLTIILWWDLS